MNENDNSEKRPVPAKLPAPVIIDAMVKQFNDAENLDQQISILSSMLVEIDQLGQFLAEVHERMSMYVRETFLIKLEKELRTEDEVAEAETKQNAIDEMLKSFESGSNVVQMKTDSPWAKPSA